MDEIKKVRFKQKVPPSPNHSHDLSCWKDLIFSQSQSQHEYYTHHRFTIKPGKNADFSLTQSCGSGLSFYSVGSLIMKVLITSWFYSFNMWVDTDEEKSGSSHLNSFPGADPRMVRIGTGPPFDG